MSIAASILPHFDQIVAGTRQHLAAIPNDRLGWRPHDKSWTVGELGSHLANLPGWTMPTLTQDALDVAPVDGDGPPPQPEYGSSEEMVTVFDEVTAAARATIEGMTDEGLMGMWTMLVGGEERFSMPKIAVLQGFIMDHLVHHRGQLTVYLRMLDIPVQQTYGPTADFPDM